MRFLLLETIEDVKKYYPKIADNIFYQLLSLDPTYDKNRDSVGQYGK